MYLKTSNQEMVEELLHSIYVVKKNWTETVENLFFQITTDKHGHPRQCQKNIKNPNAVALLRVATSMLPTDRGHSIEVE